LIDLQHNLIANALCFGRIAATLALIQTGSAHADEFCHDIDSLIAQATAGFDGAQDTGDLTALPGADECGLSDELGGMRRYHCVWEFGYRQSEAYEAFDRMHQMLHRCLRADVTETRDQPVNHPDFYERVSYRTGSIEVSVSIKDKSALQRTFAFIFIHSVSAD
jgi:hypothetical protein